jgi:23S rRNA-/tRNA-specific pseudouridylate synthase
MTQERIETVQIESEEVETGQVETVEVGAEQSGDRIDRVLASGLPALSRTRLKALILDGAVTAGGRTILDPGYRVKSGEPLQVYVPPPEPAEPEGENIPLSILYEDDALIVIDKPEGLVVHPAAGHQTGTLVNALIAHCGASLSGIGGVMRPGIVHRLDKDTSGVMVVAKTDRAHKALSEQFADHGRTGPLERAYLAFAWGVPERQRGTICRHRRQAGRQPDRVPPRDRADPPDPGASGAYRPSDPRRSDLRHGLQNQGCTAANSCAGSPGGSWKTGPACLFPCFPTPRIGQDLAIPVGTADPSCPFA